MRVWKGPEYPGDFPSLGYLISDWVQRHCVVPDGFSFGRPFVHPPEQLTFIVRHYRLKESALVGQLATAFVYRRSQLVRSQKWGKNPLVASVICPEAVGPVLFAGWAGPSDAWVCSDWGCECGWVHEYEMGEPMGMPWPTPLIQITATSEDQTDNTYDALRSMIDNGPLHAVIPKTGEEFIRLPGDGRIDVVTSNARSRLGQRVTFVPQDETGLWTPATGMVKVAETQRRGLAGMGGRAIETTNAWDPAEGSVAQRTFESKAPDIYKDYRLPPAGLSYRNKAERRRIHRFNYDGAPWVDIDSIEGEAAELLEVDPGQAERFFGNRVVAGSDAAFDPKRWAALADPTASAPMGSLITVGFGGGRYDNSAAIVATAVDSGYQWTVATWDSRDFEGQEVPGLEVTDALASTFASWDVWRVYAIPDYWDTYVDAWAGRWGKERVLAWPISQRRKPWAIALRNFAHAQAAGELSHDGDPVLAAHVGNARKSVLAGVRDDEGHPLWIVAKERPDSVLHVDAARVAALSWEARGDALAAGATPKDPAEDELVSW